MSEPQIYGIRKAIEKMNAFCQCTDNVQLRHGFTAYCNGCRKPIRPGENQLAAENERLKAQLAECVKLLAYFLGIVVTTPGILGVDPRKVEDAKAALEAAQEGER